MSILRNIHKKLLTLFILLICTITAFSESNIIHISDNQPILDNSSLTALPYYFINLGNMRGNIHIESAEFINPDTIFSPVFAFSGNSPLSYPFEKQTPEIFKNNLKPSIEYPGTGHMIKLFPYEYNGSMTIFYQDIIIDYNIEPVAQIKTEPLYDYLIICSSEYDTALIRFADWKKRMGYRTLVYTVEHIDSISSGIDIQEKIRNFIISEYTVNHFDFLLLAGDSTMVPVRKMFSMECGAGFYTDEDSIPADIYYSNLDGNFNADGDNTYGELNDNADLYADINIGRMLFEGTLHGPTPVIDRTISYEMTGETEQLNRGLFLGMILWNPPFTPGGISKDMIKNDIIPADFHIKSFYEYLGHSGDADIIDSIDMGYGIINHAGHGSYKGVWVDSMTAISTWDALGLTNGNKTGLFYSIGCWVGAFDRAVDLRNFSLCMQASPLGGAVAIITNSRYGWGAPGYPGWGVSDIFDYQFFKLLFSEDDKRVGVLLRRLKEIYAPYSNNTNLYRWHLYQLNLFGDPSLSIHTQTPDSLFINRTISGNRIEFSITDKNSLPVENVRIALSNDSVIDMQYTDKNGFVSMQGEFNNYNFMTVSKVNYLTYMDSFFVDTTPVSRFIFLNYEDIYANYTSLLEILNCDIFAHEITLNSSFIDTSFTINGGDTLLIDYTPSFYGIDTVNIRDSVNTSTDNYTYTININKNPSFISSIIYTGSNFLVTVENPLYVESEICSLHMYIESHIDTFAITSLDSAFTFSICMTPSADTPYLKFICDINSPSGLIGSDTCYTANSSFTFIDDFSSGFLKWPFHSSNWIITDDSTLHCGNDSMYLSNMNEKAYSDSFIILPETICSMYINFSFPTLESDSSGFIYDVDGLFVKLVSDSDTSVIDFISSGGALNKSIEYSGWMTYQLNYHTPAFAKLMLHFISDRDIEMRGVFINNIIVKPLYTFTAPDTGIGSDFDFSILRNSPAVINESVTYSINRVDGEMTMYIYSIDGRIISSEDILSNGTKTVYFTDLASGIYFVKFKGNGRIYSDKIIFMR